MSDLGFEPETLGREALLRFFDDHLDAFLGERQLTLAPRRKARLRTTLRRFEPAHSTPYEFMERVSSALR